MNAKIIKYPSYGKVVPWVPGSRYRPFCSERCKQIDLNAWTAGRYTIPVVEEDDPPDVPGNDTTDKLN